MIPVGVCLVTFGSTYADMHAAARDLDRLGYDSLWLWDHYLSWNDPHEAVLECWTTLAALAASTQHIRVGSLVANVINRHPARLAKVVATLAEIAGGRCELGMGSGGWVAEQQMVGIEQGDATSRHARLHEALHIIPALWRGQPVSYTGTYYQLEQAVCAPPLNPPPRIILGGRSPRMARLAARAADGLNVQWRFREQFPAVRAALDAELVAQGRSRATFDLSLHLDWRELMQDPAGNLAQWEAMGFTRVIPFVTPPYPRDEFAALARLFTA